MSWSRRGVLVCLSLAGCGFHPLYGEPDGGNAASSMTAELAAIRIESIPDRIGQEVYNMLRDRLNPNGSADRPRYVLRVVLDEKTNILFISDDQTASRVNLTLKAKYELTEAETGRVIADGVSRATASYDVLSVDVEYATVASKNAARTRAARLVCDEIRTRLALALSNDNGDS